MKWFSVACSSIIVPVLCGVFAGVRVVCRDWCNAGEDGRRTVQYDGAITATEAIRLCDCDRGLWMGLYSNVIFVHI